MADSGSGKPTRDVDDISLDDARPARRGGTGAIFVVVLIIVAIVVIALVWSNQKKVQEAKREAIKQAGIARAAQMDAVKKDLQEAVDLSAGGNVDGAISKLEAADGLMGGIITA